MSLFGGHGGGRFGSMTHSLALVVWIPEYEGLPTPALLRGMSCQPQSQEEPRSRRLCGRNTQLGTGVEGQHNTESSDEPKLGCSDQFRPEFSDVPENLTSIWREPVVDMSLGGAHPWSRLRRWRVNVHVETGSVVAIRPGECPGTCDAENPIVFNDALPTIAANARLWHHRVMNAAGMSADDPRVVECYKCRLRLVIAYGRQSAASFSRLAVTEYGRL